MSLANEFAAAMQQVFDTDRDPNPSAQAAYDARAANYYLASFAWEHYDAILAALRAVEAEGEK